MQHPQRKHQKLMDTKFTVSNNNSIKYRYTKDKIIDRMTSDVKTDEGEQALKMRTQLTI